ncbi:MAG: hypothetical protein WCA10_03440 [Terracidiphilus sp.]
MREVGAFLNVVIGDQPKDAALGEDGGFVVKRSIFEVKGQVRGHTIAMHDLDQVAKGEDPALFRA